MGKDVECPYCREYVEINHDDGYGYNEDDLHQQECVSCEKTFTYTTTIHFSYSTNKADCLNYGEHQYEKTKTFPTRYARMRCTACGDEKPLPPNAAFSGDSDKAAGVPLQSTAMQHNDERNCDV